MEPNENCSFTLIAQLWSDSNRGTTAWTVHHFPLYLTLLSSNNLLSFVPYFSSIAVRKKVDHFPSPLSLSNSSPTCVVSCMNTQRSFSYLLAIFSQILIQLLPYYNCGLQKLYIGVIMIFKIVMSNDR